jgi:hypothetical protein
MGLMREAVAFLAAARSAGADFDRTLTIGRHWMVASPSGLRRGLREAGHPISYKAAEQLLWEGQGYSEPVLRHLGARVLESVDASDYEGATIVHDLNQPLPDELRGRYSMVIDSGALEHVFDFPAAIKSCMEAVAVGGHLVLITVTNNFSGHGFYQFSPELLFRVLGERNGFEVRCMLVRAWRPFARWYRVADPAQVGHRVEPSPRGRSEVLMYVFARRVEDREIFADIPQQSDYVPQWETVTEVPVYHRPHGVVPWLRGRIPSQLGEARAYLKHHLRSPARPDDFRPVSLSEPWH